MVIKTGSSNKTMLFIEDNKKIQNIVKKVVTECEYRLDVIAALTGEEALNILQNDTLQAKPNIIILDLNLPAMGGEEVLKIIQADQNLKHIPVVVLTASDDENELENLKKAGARECYTKPFDFFMFNKMLEHILKQWLASPEARSI